MIVGREAERAAVAAVLDAARRGEGAALVLSGEPGAGKSALLTDVLAGVDDLRVLRVRGVESESPLAFAALHRLLRPLLSGTASLPGRQAAALRAALGLTDAETPSVDRFAVYLATLTLLSEAAAVVPVVVAVDDVHWLDDASRDAILFVARRVDGERLAMLLAVRDEAPSGTEDLPTLTVGRLDLSAARALLSAEAGGDVPEDVARHLHARTAGNALALSELGRVLDHEVLLGRVPLPADLPMTGGVEAAFLERYRLLDDATRTVVLVAAADDAGDRVTIERAARALGAGDAAVEDAARSGLLHLRQQRVELRHPLVRSAVYGGATPGERRRVHGALADALTAAGDADRRTWHRAAATDRPDEDVVADLEASARRSAGLGGHEAASAAWERAAELSADPLRRARRLHEAADAAWTAGRPDRAAILADAALLAAEDPALHADATLLRARVEWNTGSVHVAHHRLLAESAAVADHHPMRAREMAMFAASLAATVPIEPGVDPRTFLGQPQTDRERCVAEVLRAFVHITRHEWAPAVAAVRSAEAYSEHSHLGVDGLLANVGLAAMHVALDDVALRLHERLLHSARDDGAHIMVLYALTRRGGIDAVLGRWDLLATGAQEALTLAEATGRAALTAMPRAWLAVVAALRGDDDAAERLVELEAAVATGATGTTEASVRDQLLWARALTAGSPAAAIHHYEQMTHGFAERMNALDRIETAARSGRRDLAERWLSDIAAFARGTGSPWAAAVAEHGLALLTEGPDVGVHLQRALELHAQARRRVDTARTQLAYGEWLRRERRRVDARAHLREALHTFEDVGARRWAERAAQELRASGERVVRREAGNAPAMLTPTELQVARLVARGLPTKDVAGQLFVSPRTVDFHLRNVFTKLGVTSRGELAHASLE
ncbi:AAA family ATPase [Cellulomonas fimi]|uniref:ATP-binding protein n=1 Tax=Cellulomonas fimi TaxID=1708 RepID=UPI00234CDB21|nr:AAA family ATPase [Cellulomonas fimi]MDC7120853.1 AAA family ATPase [Cellulomonas fimi]